MVVDVSKLSSDYVKLRLTHYFFNGCSFRNSNAPKNILFIVVISHGMYERIDGELILLSVQLMRKLDPKSMKYVSSFP